VGPPGIFGTSGIRGVFNEEVTAELAVEVGMALATLRGPGPYTLAHDARKTGMALAHAFSAGVMACGGDVAFLGLLPTGALAFLTRELGAKAGCIITASHNPPEYNGLKLFRSDSSPLWPEEESRLEGVLRSRSFRRSGWGEVGSYRTLDVSDLYVEALADLVELKRRWKVVLDPGCGSASLLAPRIFEEVGCEVIAINNRPDGSFPARSPDPRPDTVSELMSCVREKGADVGFAYDGDADRMVIVDEKGNFVPFDVALAAFAAPRLRGVGGGLIITTVEASYCVDEAVRAEGGRVMRTKVGDKHVSREVVRSGAIFGGEPCGAWVIPEVHLCADGILASLMVLAAMDGEGVRPSEFFGWVPRFHTVREKVPCPNELKGAVMEDLRELLPTCFRGVVGLIDIDGLRLELEGGWVLVRPSGTEPVVRITAEARGVEEARSLLLKARSLVEEAVEKALSRS